MLKKILNGVKKQSWPNQKVVKSFHIIILRNFQMGGDSKFINMSMEFKLIHLRGTFSRLTYFQGKSKKGKLEEVE